jgi:Fe-Mn family superoxide dismutase
MAAVVALNGHQLPALPYPTSALEPHIDERTLLLHHGQHHASYVRQLNAALAPYPEWRPKSALWLVRNWGKLPEPIRATVRNNAGGHVNHSLFWRAMSPAGGGAPEGALAEAIARDFGSLELFKARFDAAGTALFGAGWVWLARAQQDGSRLEVLTTPGHEHPQSQGRYPVLVNDAWEHAYYLKHQNRRADYLKGWWPVVDWREAERRFLVGE